METIIAYFLKSSGILIVFYLAYYFLLRKVTFFNQNRWFLASGLVTSALLPFYFIEKIIYVEPDLTVSNLNPITNHTTTIHTITETSLSSVNWIEIAMFGYLIIVSFLFLKFAFQFISLYSLLKNKAIEKNGTYFLINIEQDIAPFSFFNYIVFNSKQYSETELKNILLHEKVHSSQKHSLDVIITNLFCIAFWFNPIIWLYKKAIIQNLEFIADEKATQKLEDKKQYQLTLLKAVFNENCHAELLQVQITNHFYQSLIKKRIIMLNKNQSHRKNSWKYVVVIPVLVAFIYLFQVKVVAQLKNSNHEVTDMTWTKISTDEEFKNDVEAMAKSNLIFHFNKIIRNPENEITSITISYKDKLGNDFTKIFQDKNGIKPIHFIRDIDENGTGSIGYHEKANNNETIDAVAVGFVTDKNATVEEMKTDSEELKKQGINYVFSNVKRNKKGEIIAIKITFDDHNGHNGTSNSDGDEPINPIYFNADNQNGEIGFTDAPNLSDYIVDEKLSAKFGTEVKVKRDKSKDKLIPSNPIKHKEIPVVIVVPEISKKSKIIRLENGNEILIFNNNIKIPSYPSVKFTDNSPILIINGIEQKNPSASLEILDVTKIKTIIVFDENNEEKIGTQIKKMILTTK